MDACIKDHVRDISVRLVERLYWYGNSSLGKVALDALVARRVTFLCPFFLDFFYSRFFDLVS